MAVILLILQQKAFYDEQPDTLNYCDHIVKLFRPENAKIKSKCVFIA